MWLWAANDTHVLNISIKLTSITNKQICHSNKHPHASYSLVLQLENSREQVSWVVNSLPAKPQQRQVAYINMFDQPYQDVESLKRRNEIYKKCNVKESRYFKIALYWKSRFQSKLNLKTQIEKVEDSYDATHITFGDDWT